MQLPLKQYMFAWEKSIQDIADDTGKFWAQADRWIKKEAVVDFDGRTGVINEIFHTNKKMLWERT